MGISLEDGMKIAGSDLCDVTILHAWTGVPNSSKSVHVMVEFLNGCNEEWIATPLPSYHAACPEDPELCHFLHANSNCLVNSRPKLACAFTASQQVHLALRIVTNLIS